MRTHHCTAALLLLALGSPNVATCAESVKLTVSYAFPAIMRSPLEEIARRFAAENPNVAIEFELPAVDYEELTQRTLRAALTGTGADIALHGYHRVRLLAAQSAAAPIDRFIADEGNFETKGYARSARTLCEHDGRTYGLPFSTATQIVYYNTDIVRRAGANPDEVPKTWAAVIELAKKIDKLKGGVTSIFFDYKGAGNWGFLGLVQSHGGRMMTDDEQRIILDGHEGMAALDLLKAFGEAGQVDMSRAQAQQAFSAGALGILVYTSSALTVIEKQVAGRFEIRTGAFPLSSPEGRLPAGGNCAMMLTKNAAKQPAAWEFIKFAAGPIGQTIMATGTGYMPSNTVAIERPDLLGGFYERNPNYQTSVRQLPVMTSFWTWPGANSIKIQTVIEDQLTMVATLQRPPEGAMPDIIRQVKALLSK